MDAQRFDSLARSLSHLATRRAALGALLGGLLAPLLPADAEGKRGTGKNRGGRKKNRRANEGSRVRPRSREPQRVEAEAACYPGSPCLPGPGKNLGKCDFSDSPALKSKNLKGANLGSANLSDADASGANFIGANLGKACLVDANLTGAKINGTTNLGGAIFCRTTMPDGTENNSGCAMSTACCPTCDDCAADEQCCGGECISDQACCTGNRVGCRGGDICCMEEGAPGQCEACCIAPELCTSDGECCDFLDYICSGGRCCVPTIVDRPCFFDEQCCSGRCFIPPGMDEGQCVDGV